MDDKTSLRQAWMEDEPTPAHLIYGKSKMLRMKEKIPKFKSLPPTLNFREPFKFCWLYLDSYCQGIGL